MRSKPRYFPRQPRIIFTQPHRLMDTEVPGDRVVVIDIAFSLTPLPAKYALDHPQARQFYEEELDRTTVAFIDRLDNRLALWIDHHDHTGWERYRQDPCFYLVSSSRAPACAVLVDAALFLRTSLSEVDCIVSHGDLDGILATARFLLGGNPPYPEAVNDAVKADTRRGSLSQKGACLDRALKADTEESVRHEALRWLVQGDRQAGRVVRRIAGDYGVLEDHSRKVAEKARPVGCCRIADARDGTGPIDFTRVLNLLQAGGGPGIVIYRQDNRDYIDAAWKESRLSLPEIFQLPGGSPCRVKLEAGHLPDVVNRLHQAADAVGYNTAISFPRQAMVEISRRCNLGCALCPVGSGRARQMPDMSQDIFQRLIDSFAPFLESLTLHNYGEPLLHPQVAELIEYAYRSGIEYLDLNTNGLYMTPPLASKLVRSGLDRIRVSIDSTDPGTYRIYRGRGCPEQVLKNIELLREAREAEGSATPRIEAQALVMRQNELGLAKFRAVMRDAGADGVRFKTFNLYMSGEKPADGGRDFLPRNAAFSRYDSPEPFTAGPGERLQLCRWPWDRLVVLADGTFTPCCHDFNGEFSLGRITQAAAGELWDTAARREFMARRILEPRTIAMCRRCSSAVPSLGRRKEISLDAISIKERREEP